MTTSSHLIAGLHGMAHELDRQRRLRTQEFVDRFVAAWQQQITSMTLELDPRDTFAVEAVSSAEALAIIARAVGRTVIARGTNTIDRDLIPLTLAMLRAEWRCVETLADASDVILECSDDGRARGGLRARVQEAVVVLDGWIARTDVAEPSRMSGMLLALLGCADAGREPSRVSLAEVEGLPADQWAPHLLARAAGRLPSGPVLEERAWAFTDAVLAPLSAVFDGLRERR